MSAVAEQRVIDVNILGNARQPVEIPDELTVLEGTEQPRKGFGVFRMLSPKYGDQRVTWDSASLAEINAAKKLFLELVQKGLTPYKVGSDGKKSSEIMTEFDPHAEEIIFVPMKMVVGG